MVTYLRAIYSGRANADTLSRITDESYEELDKQYGKFIEATRP